MKKHTKILALVLTLTFIMLLSSCSRTSPYGEGAVSGNKPLPKETTTVEETTEETTPEETSEQKIEGKVVNVYLKRELEKPAEEYTIEDFSEVGAIYFEFLGEGTDNRGFCMIVPLETTKEELSEIHRILSEREDVEWTLVEGIGELCMITDPSACNT